MLNRESVFVVNADDDQRSRADSLIERGTSDDVLAAGQILRALRQPQLDDFLTAAWCFSRAEAWDECRAALESSFAIEETAQGRYLMAFSFSRGLRYAMHGVTEEDLTRARNELERAVTLPDVPAHAYMALANMLAEYREEDRPRVAELAQLAMAVDPSAAEPRIKLATILPRNERTSAKILELLNPLLQRPRPPSKACWIAFYAFEREGQLDTALSLLNRIEPKDMKSAAWLRAAKADCLASAGRYDDALALWGDLVASAIDPEVQANAYVQRAYTLLRSATREANAPEAVTRVGDDSLSIAAETRDDIAADVLAAVAIWFESDLAGLGVGTVDAVDGGHEIIQLPSESPVLSFAWSVIPTRDMTKEQAAQLAFVVLNVSGDVGEDLSKQRQQDLRTCIARSPHPKMYHAMAMHYAFSETPDRAQAIRFGLLARIHSCRQTSNDESGSARSSKLSLEVQPDSLVGVDRLNVHAVAKELLRTEWDDLTAKLFTDFYLIYWRELLIDGELYDELAEAAYMLEALGGNRAMCLFDRAYAADKCRRLDEAVELYRQAIAEREHAAALHNLSLILEQRGQLTEAAELAGRAAKQHGASPSIQGNATRLADRIERLADENRRRDDLLRSATERWPSLDQYKRRLVATCLVISAFDDWAHLAQLSGIDEKYLPGHWRKLVEAGMIIESDTGWSINPHVVPLVERERTHAVATRIIRADESIAYKPIFNSRQEYLIYSILLGLFPNHLVFPNMALQSVFQYDRMKALLPKNEFEYYLKAHVDICVVSTATYFPLLCFEVDSRFHDEDQQRVRDGYKDTIFKRGGVPLLRLRSFGSPTPDAMRSDIIGAIRHLEADMRALDGAARSLLAELDLTALSTETISGAANFGLGGIPRS